MKKLYEVELAAPGFSEKDFSITVDNGVLTVSAEKNSSAPSGKKDLFEDDGNFSFMRSFHLPMNINEKSIDATYTEGILRLTLPEKG